MHAKYIISVEENCTKSPFLAALGEEKSFFHCIHGKLWYNRKQNCNKIVILFHIFGIFLNWNKPETVVM